MKNRPVEIVAGILLLLSVVSVPIPVPRKIVVVSATPDVGRFDRLHQEALSQRQELTILTNETRALSNAISVMDASQEPQYFQAAPPSPRRLRPRLNPQEQRSAFPPPIF